MAEAKKSKSTKQTSTSKTVKKSAKEERQILEKIKDVDRAVVQKEAEEIVSESDTATNEEAKTKVAKAGKRSPKALKEAEEKQTKEERKASEATADVSKAPKKAVKPTRGRLERRGKKYREAAKTIETNKQYSLNEAVLLVEKTSTVKFDATVELHVKLGVDPKQADQNIRNTVSLPAGTGKNIRIAVFADVDDAKKAKNAGADIAGNEEFLQQLDKGEIHFDILISTPQLMSKLSKYARILGPKGLMPNPKSGTVASDVAKAVNDAKGGKVEYRVDSTGIVHLAVGKVSFKPEQLNQNLQAVLASIKASKPASLKGAFVEAAYITTTMGPSIPVLLSEV